MSVAPESGRNRIMIYGPKNDGTYVVEFKTADGEALAISVPCDSGPEALPGADALSAIPAGWAAIIFAGSRLSRTEPQRARPKWSTLYYHLHKSDSISEARRCVRAARAPKNETPNYRALRQGTGIPLPSPVSAHRDDLSPDGQPR